MATFNDGKRPQIHRSGRPHFTLSSVISHLMALFSLPPQCFYMESVLRSHTSNILPHLNSKVVQVFSKEKTALICLLWSSCRGWNGLGEMKEKSPKGESFSVLPLNRRSACLNVSWEVGQEDLSILTSGLSQFLDGLSFPAVVSTVHPADDALYCIVCNISMTF